MAKLRDNIGKAVKYTVAALGMVVASQAFAQDLTLGTVATTVTDSMTGIAKLITAGSLVAGMAFAVGAILKFKQHKDNPTQIPVGTPIALIFIAAALLFLPTIFSTLGNTLFGKSAQTGGISGQNEFVNSAGGGG